MTPDSLYAGMAETPDAETQYSRESEQALRDFQSGRIGFHEWNRRQREACEQYWSKLP